MESSIAVFLLRQLACELLPTSTAHASREKAHLHHIGEVELGQCRFRLAGYSSRGGTLYIRRGCKPLLLRALGGEARGNLGCPANCVDGLS